MRQAANRVVAMVRGALGGSVQDVGERPADVRDAWEGWPGPPPEPRRRRSTRWSWNKEGKR